MALLSGATTIDVADLIDDASDDSLDGTSHLIIEDDEEDNDPEAEAEAEPMCDAEEEAEAEVLPIAPPAAPPDAGKEKVAQSKSAELLLSIFPHRPPTIFFERPPNLPGRQSSATSTADAPERVRVPLESSRALCMRIEKNANSVRHAFKRAGFAVNPPGNSSVPLVCWARHTGDKLWKELPLGSIVNHFPGSWTLGRKDGLSRILTEQQRRLGNHDYNFVPQTFTLPGDRRALERAWSEGTLMGGGAFIVKPLNSSRGRGIHICNDIDEIEPDAKVLVQEYIHRPLLLQERKFDLRIYVLVTSFEPLRAYTYDQGLCRFATQPYAPPSADDVGSRSAHLTNYSINKHDKTYIANEDAEEDGVGHKWSLAACYRALSEKGIDVAALRKRVDALLAKTLIAAQPHVSQKYGQLFRRRNACFELFGFDVMLDADVKPWLIEVNVSPDLASTSPLDRQLKGTLAADTLHLVGVKAPQPLCDAASDRCATSRMGGNGVVPGPPTPHDTEPPMFARQFHNGRHHSELQHTPFANLQQDELNLLVETEEEWSRASSTGFRRIYPPTSASMQERLSKLFEVSRYADQLTLAYAKRGSGRLDELNHALATLGRRTAPAASSATERADAPAPSTNAPTGYEAAIAAAKAAAAACRAGGGSSSSVSSFHSSYSSAMPGSRPLPRDQQQERMPPGYNSSHTALLRAAAAARARDQQRMSISSRSTSRGKSPGHSKKPRSASARPGTSHGTHAGSGLAAARKQRSSAVSSRPHTSQGLAAPTGGPPPRSKPTGGGPAQVWQPRVSKPSPLGRN